MPPRPRTSALAALAALVLAAGGLLACWGEGRGDLLTAPVERGSIEAAIQATGVLNPVKTVEVGTYVSGRIVSIDVDFNSSVHKGQRVAKIDPANYQVKVQQAEASVATASARVQRADADLRLKTEQLARHRTLLAQKVVSQDAFDAAQSAFDQARAQSAVERAALDQARAGLADARVNLDYTDIVSPVDGIVLARNVNVGQTVAASFQTPTLFLIADDLTRMQVNTSVSESDIGRVAEGQLARFSVDAYPERIFRGRVTQIRNAPISVQNVVTYDVIIELENPDLALKPGMTATVTVVTDVRDDVLVVPLRALRFRPEHEAAPPPVGSGARSGRLWVRNGTGLQPVEVELGVRDDEAVEIVAGAVQTGDEAAIGYRRR